MSSSAVTDLLRGVGLRVTGPRVAVLEVLAEHPHSDATDVLRLTRERSTDISVQGVYDVLSSLTAHGLLRRIQPAHSVARFEVDHGDNHHHVVCRSCQQIVDVACAGAGAPCLDATHAELLGFSVQEAEVIYWGLCADCQREATHDADVGAPQNSPSIPHTLKKKKEKA